MGEGVKTMLAKPIQLADQVCKLAGNAQSFRSECAELKAKADKLASLLRQAARADLYERPAVRIMTDTAQALTKASALAEKCLHGHSMFRRLFTLTPANAFPRTAALLDNAIEDVAWLLRISTPSNGDDDDGLPGLPNSAQNEPILFLIWGHIARLHTGSLAARADSAADLASLAHDNAHFAKRIIEEDGIVPLVRLLKEGTDDGQEAAVKALGLLGCDEESIDQLIHAGVCSAFSSVLKDVPMRVQAAVAEAIGYLADTHPGCQDLFAQSSAIRHLVGHLAYETIQEHSKYTVNTSSKVPSVEPMKSLHSVVLAKTQSIRSSNAQPYEPPATSSGSSNQPRRNQMQSVVQSAMAAKSTANGITPPVLKTQLGSIGKNSREAEDPATKAHMKEMAAFALWKLARGNVNICKSITESRALLCFAVLLEKGDGGAGTNVQYYSAMALMEIALVAEHNLLLRQSAFKPNSPAAKAVVDQLLRVVLKGEYDNLLLPCITAIGCLARTFTASETRMVPPLVHLLDERDALVTKEAITALTKFACTENHLHKNHCKAIVDAGGAPHLVQLVYLGDVQIEALILLTYIALHMPESEELAQVGVLAVLLWASKQVHMVQDPQVETLLPDAKARLELFQSRASR